MKGLVSFMVIARLGAKGFCLVVFGNVVDLSIGHDEKSLPEDM